MEVSAETENKYIKKSHECSIPSVLYWEATFPVTGYLNHFQTPMVSGPNTDLTPMHMCGSNKKQSCCHTSTNQYHFVKRYHVLT